MRKKKDRLNLYSILGNVNGKNVTFFRYAINRESLNRILIQGLARQYKLNYYEAECLSKTVEWSIKLCTGNE